MVNALPDFLWTLVILICGVAVLVIVASAVSGKLNDMEDSDG